MTEIDFYHNAEDKFAAANRLIGELYRQGRRVLVYAPVADIAARIDRLLWIQPAIGFVPHCLADSPLTADTPIVIGAALDDLTHDDVLINLDGDLPPGFGRFQRLVEIVGRDEADRGPARNRYKFYRDRGYALKAQDWSHRS